MKPAFQKQLAVSFCIIILFSILNTVFQHWIFSSIGHCLCGLLWIFHPVKINDIQPERKQLAECRIAGGILILLGILLRARLY